MGKRCFDIALAFAGLVLLSPLFLIVAVLIKTDSAGPVFFRQERVGRCGRPFRIHKFRTMLVHAERQGPQLTVGADRRITRVGAVLRKYKLDELPQLIDVLFGSMSLVGPRPEVPQYVALYPAEGQTPDQISATRAVFQPETSIISFLGNVKITWRLVAGTVLTVGGVVLILAG